MVFQNYALYPHMTVYKNMAFGLKLRRTPRREIDVRVRDAARVLGIEHLLERKPKALSGGQRQRVAVGRAIVRDPACFLFDEPLSNLDAKLRVETRAELKRLHKRLQTTTIYVTHDQEEAMTLGDRVVVMADGVIRQADTPLKVYNEPADRFVASFLGTPPMNFLNGRVESRGGALRFAGGGFDVALPPVLAGRVADQVDREVVLGIRPEGFYLRRNEAASDEDATVEYRVDVVEPLGNTMDVYGATTGIDIPSDRVPVVDAEAGDVEADTASGDGNATVGAQQAGGSGGVGSSGDGRHLVARVKAERLEEGRVVKMYLDMTKAHIFEPGPFGLNLTLPVREQGAMASEQDQAGEEAGAGARALS